MMNLLTTLIAFYESVAYTNNYIIGYTYKNTVYFTTTTNEVLPFLLKLETASGNGGKSIRLKMNNKTKEMLMVKNSTVLCSSEYFENLVKNTKYNRGEIFEKLVTEFFGQEWTKDNNKFTDCGDIEVNGIAYQIKYEKATFINELTMANIKKAL